jgi:hypothetical protein
MIEAARNEEDRVSMKIMSRRGRWKDIVVLRVRNNLIFCVYKKKEKERWLSRILYKVVNLQCIAMLCGIYPQNANLCKYETRKTSRDPVPIPHLSLFNCSLSNLLDRRSALGTVGNRVQRLIELKLEVLSKFLLDRSLDRRKDVDKDTEVRGVLLIVVAALEHTGAHKARVPAVHVSTDNVGRRVVANHVDVLGEALVVVDCVHPTGNHLVGVLVCSQLGLAVHDTLEIDASERLVHGLEADAEGTLRHAGVGVLGGAQEIALGEVDGDALRDGVLGLGVEAAVLGLQKVHDDLHVGGVVAGVGEDHNGVDVHLGEVTRVGGLALLLGEDAVRGDGRVPGDDVVRHDNVLEAILLGNFAALVALATDDENGLVVVGKCTHGSVRLDELLGRDGVVENLGELLATGRLGLTGAVGEEDVGDLDAELVVSVENLENTLALGDQAVTVDKDTVDVEDESHVLGGIDLLALHILKLGSDDVARWLDRRHAGALGAANLRAIRVVDGGQPRLPL